MVLKPSKSIRFISTRDVLPRSCQNLYNNKSNQHFRGCTFTGNCIQESLINLAHFNEFMVISRNHSKHQNQILMEPASYPLLGTWDSPRRITYKPKEIYDFRGTRPASRPADRPPAGPLAGQLRNRVQTLPPSRRPGCHRK